MKKIILPIITSIFLLSINNIYSQKVNAESTIEKIGSFIKSYFELNRETIHLQLNKTTFLSDEEIWFKGYVYDRKSKTPFLLTTNIYATLYDEVGKKIEEKLLYANSGNFTGRFELNNNLTSGKYYIQVYTNWMNNFKEDESSIFQIQIINKEEPNLSNYTINPSNINVEFYPEGGNLIAGIANTIGIKVGDCNDMPLPITEIQIVSVNGEKSQKVYLNEFGHGKFELFPGLQTFKSVINFNNEKIETYLPTAFETGISLEANSYTREDEIILKIKTNKKTLNLLQEKPLFIIINQDDKVSFLDVELNKNTLDQTIIFSSKKLRDGVNTITIIDKDLNKFAERQIFKYPENKTKLSFHSYQKTKDTIDVIGKLNSDNTNLSLTILPENSISINQESTIFSSFLLHPYLRKKNYNSNYLFNYTTRESQYDLDLLLLNQKKLKYNWEDIKSLSPKINYEFEYGITLKGTINQVLSNKEKYKIQLFSLKSGINESTEINDKNEFYFKNLVLADSTEMDLTLIEDSGKLLSLKVYPQILNGRSKFNKAFKPEEPCNHYAEKIDIEIPTYKDQTVKLKQVEINEDKKKIFKHQNNIGNNLLKAYKFSDTDNNTNLSLLQFIEEKGFIVINKIVTIEIYSRILTSLNAEGKSKPEIFIDNVEIRNFDILMDMKLDEVEEIYLSTTLTIIPSIRNRTGTIKIYRKKGLERDLNYKRYSVPYIVKNGFSKTENFKPNNYTTTENKGFQNFGIIKWIPSITTRSNSDFNFQIPDLKQKKAKILIEGFSSDGKLISEIKTIDLPQ